MLSSFSSLLSALAGVVIIFLFLLSKAKEAPDLLPHVGLLVHPSVVDVGQAKVKALAAVVLRQTNWDQWNDLQADRTSQQK